MTIAPACAEDEVGAVLDELELHPEVPAQVLVWCGAAVRAGMLPTFRRVLKGRFEVARSSGGVRVLHDENDPCGALARIPVDGTGFMAGAAWSELGACVDGSIRELGATAEGLAEELGDHLRLVSLLEECLRDAEVRGGILLHERWEHEPVETRERNPYAPRLTRARWLGEVCRERVWPAGVDEVASALSERVLERVPGHSCGRDGFEPTSGWSGQWSWIRHHDGAHPMGPRQAARRSVLHGLGEGEARIVWSGSECVLVACSTELLSALAENPELHHPALRAPELEVAARVLDEVCARGGEDAEVQATLASCVDALAQV